MKKTENKRLPRSKLGAAFAIAYLLLVFSLFTVALTGSGGLHGSAAMASLFAIGLTLPLSLVVMWLADLLNSGTPNSPFELLFLAMLPVCGLINAGVIYLVVGFASRALRSLANKLARKLN